MNKTLEITAIALVAVVMVIGSIAPVMAAPSSGEKDNACAKEKNPKSSASQAVGCGDADGDGVLDRYDPSPEDPCDPNPESEACIPEEEPA